MKKEEKREFYIVDKRILPKSVQNVIKVNELIHKMKISKYEAIKRIGISRSTYYKYKDFIKPFFESGGDKIYSVHLTVTDRTGMLSDVLDVIANENINILTVVQNMPIDGEAKTTIVIKTTDDMLKKVELMLDKIRKVKGVKDIRMTGSN